MGRLRVHGRAVGGLPYDLLLPRSCRRRRRRRAAALLPRRLPPDLPVTRQSRIAVVALTGGVALGIALTVGTARLVYAGGGFLAATGVLVALTLAALGAGAWGGDPQIGRASGRERV